VTGLALRGRVLAPGTATGLALVLDEPLSLWGGLDPATGRIVERRHPQHGEPVTGRVLIMPATRGSSSSASVLAESVRARTAPAAIVLGEPDLILAVGAAVAEELYRTRIPVVVIDPGWLPDLRSGMRVRIEEDGRLLVD
jgi:predicted aconitase with swiveling domain